MNTLNAEYISSNGPFAPLVERTLLRGLIDNPAFAHQVMPVLAAELFYDAASAALYTFIASDYQQHQTAPDLNILRVRNDREPGHNEATVKAVDALIGELQAMTPIAAIQMPILIKEAEEWIRRRKVHSLLSRIISAEENGVDPRALTAELQAAYDWRFGNNTTGRYTFKTRQDLLNSSTAPFLVQNLLIQNSLVALVSPPGSNKTFLALDLALSISSGQSTWLGQTLHLRGPVVYVLGEGGGRFKLRVQAWDQQHGIGPSQSYPFHFISEAVALINFSEASAFVREIAALEPVLIVFDTLSRCLAGADENNQKDMSAAVGVCDTLRQQLGCCVLLLHHTTKDGTVERGSSVLRGAVDTLLVLKVPDTSEPHFMMSCEKQKDAEPFGPINLVREQVSLASERDPHTGDPAVSCVVTVATSAQAAQHVDRRLWKAQQFMVKNPMATKTKLADYLGGRKGEALDQIAQWMARGEIRFQPRRRISPLVSLKSEQMASRGRDNSGSERRSAGTWREPNREPDSSGSQVPKC